MLTKMLEESNALKDYPKPQQNIFMKLASTFQSNTQHLFLDHEELQHQTEIGTPEQWKELLNMNETQAFVKAQMGFISQIAQRKTFRSLVESALEGNHQAAKQINDISGVLNQQDNNRTVVLHYVPRPETKEVSNETKNN